MLTLNPTQLAALNRLRPSLPGAYRPADNRSPLDQLGRRDRQFERSLKSGRGHREAQSTAYHLLPRGHTDRADPLIPAHWVHETRVKHLAFSKAPGL